LVLAQHGARDRLRALHDPSDLAAFGLQPHRAATLKLSTDPFFVDRVRNIVGLYLAPSDIARVLAVDEKPAIQALERAQGYLKPPNARGTDRLCPRIQAPGHDRPVRRPPRRHWPDQG
jgi:hypothetical protein